MTDAPLEPSLTSEQAARLLEELRGADRKLYRAVLASSARRRRLRPEFLDRKPLPERHAWVAAELARPASATAATEFVQTWLLTCRKPMLRAFLDALGVPHDGEGVVETLPPEPPEATLRSAVGLLLNNYPEWEVRLYLAMFCGMDIADWPRLREIARETFQQPPAPCPA